MMSLPAIAAMAGLVLAGMDHRRWLHTQDSAERAIDVAVAEEVLRVQRLREDNQRQALAGEVGNRVGTIVGRAVNEALKEIARAFSTRS